MRREDLRRLIVLATLLLAAPAASAQPMMGGGGGGGMPDLSQIVGRPLPDRGMPTGTVSVRVGRKMPANAVADTEVSAIIKNAGGDLRKRALKTDDTGRALFEGMSPGDEFHAEVDGRRRAPEDRDIHDAAGGRPAHDADLAAWRAAGGSGAPAPAAPDRHEAGPAAAGGKDQRTFALGATAGAAEPDAALPTGTLEVRLFDENGAPIAEPPDRARHGQGGRRSTSATARATPPAWRASPICPSGHRPATRRSSTGRACASARRRSRCPKAAARAPRSARWRAPPIRRRSPSARAAGSSLQMHEDTLQILEFLPLENTLRQDVRPGAGRDRDPAAQRVRGRAGPGERTQGRGAAEPRHGRARPDRPPGVRS